MCSHLETVFYHNKTINIIRNERFEQNKTDHELKHTIIGCVTKKDMQIPTPPSEMTPSFFLLYMVRNVLNRTRV